jgi:hypothetical protein
VALSWCHQDRERAALAVAGQVDFGRQSAPGSTGGVIVRFVRPVLPPFSVGRCGVLVSADDGGADLHRPVDVPGRIGVGLDLLQGPVEPSPR